ncbi:bifunctional oligoribonuclease/PAP phosphatase NrnA [Candidatus Mcinerneyibacteriota bacterium]|nr:bifunctional oligoribonuclease/PAP phosphatase NrnA [Candidatus Mcinerneyibacteriota bacterium]
MTIRGSKELLNVVLEKKRFLLSAHERPDGDAWSSLAAMTLLLKSFGKEAAVIGNAARAREYSFLTEQLSFDTMGPWDAFIALDCGSKSRIAGGAAPGAYLINIDHHADNDRYGDLNIVEPRLSSTAELIWRLSGEWKAENLPRDFYLAVYTGIMTDTGNFSYSNTSSETLKAASDILTVLGDPAELHTRIYHTLSPERVLIRGRVMSRLRLHCRGRIVLSHVTREDMEELGLTPDDLEGAVDGLRSVGGSEIYILMKEKEGAVRLSIRSKGKISVNGFAASLDEGGGHDFAAGATFRGTLEEAEKAIVAYWEERL